MYTLVGNKAGKEGKKHEPLYQFSGYTNVSSTQQQSILQKKLAWKTTKTLSETTLHLVYQMKTRRGPSTHGNENVFQIPEGSEIFTESKRI